MSNTFSDSPRLYLVVEKKTEQTDINPLLKNKNF